MDVRLSAEQVALKESAARLLDALAPGNVAGLDDAERSAKLDAAVAAAGWRELRMADEAGGPLASGVETMLVAIELGRTVADTSFLGPLLAGDLARRAGIESTVDTTVALTADLASLALVGDVDAVAIDSQACRTAYVTTAAGGGRALVPAALTSPAVVHDLTRPVASLDGSADVVTDGLPLESADLDAWTACALVAICGDLVGVMQGATALARDYALVREQFGRSIGSFQSVQHLLADAHVAAEGAYSLTLHAAWAVDALSPAEALLAARQAKAYCSRAARSVCESAIQVHGGIGNTWECMAHVYLRRALHSSALLGGVGASISHVLAHHGIKGE